MINTYSLIVFDWDGTLVDSVPNIVRALSLAADDIGLPLLEEAEYRSIIGMSLGNAFRALYPEVSTEQQEQGITAYKAHHRHLEQDASKLFQGVSEGLEKIRGTGTAISVATGKRKAGLERSMAANGYQYGQYFNHCRTADDAASKPDPDMLNQLLETLKLSPEQAIMVGDSVHDMAMAKNAGMDRVAVSYGAQGPDELQQYQPVLVADHFNDFIGWLGLKP